MSVMCLPSGDRIYIGNYFNKSSHAKTRKINRIVSVQKTVEIFLEKQTWIMIKAEWIFCKLASEGLLLIRKNFKYKGKLFFRYFPPHWFRRPIRSWSSHQCLCLRPVFALIREGLKLLGFRVKYSKIKGGPILKWL